ncbi:hypothetical protein [Prochlorococcus marinus]|uniref:hypothetical protein n=1 Tax=Prochlorococcus marinus TaxID=1219 RepID=UPI001ADB51FB|nr:hypothetical protein [Prochlorococcus marinus]MBO8219391.1 hypothetical protein [Prochlorococcus marinus CUG1416]MBW3051770.1 hypothetical protein [Prochlorococcus marinus str. MU1416]
MKIANIFEKKFLFRVGRHFWNIVGVSGFIALLTGIILFVEGNTLENAKSKKRFIGKDKIITSEKISNVTAEMLTYEEWKDQKGKEQNQLLSFDEWIKDNASSSETLLSFDEWLLNKEISMPERSTREYKNLKNQYLKYQENFISGVGSSQYDNYQVYKEDFLEKASQEYEGYEVYKEPFMKEQKTLSFQKKQQEKKYDQYLDDVDNRNSLKRGRAIVSPFVMGYGLAVIASASLSSAVLAIERNSRDKE